MCESELGDDFRGFAIVPDILAWAVQGARFWSEQGLGKPPEVASANDDWRSENDQLGRFIEECCVVSESLKCRARPLYESYRRWIEGAGESAISETLFGTRLKEKGLSKDHRRDGTFYSGIALSADDCISAH
jgi:putative DNA primase/helicase